jgi:hypothetical protein
MHLPGILNSPIIRNIFGFLLLLLVHAMLDWQNFVSRSGSEKYTPYVFLVMMYLWIVVHNRILFEKMFLKGQKLRYLAITIGLMAIFSFNIHVITSSVFNVTRTLPHVISFWVYTVTGLGIFVLYRYLGLMDKIQIDTASRVVPHANGKFRFSSDGRPYELDYKDVLYIESLENYVKVFSRGTFFIVRQSLKQTEELLPRSVFIRISRSHIVNASLISRFDNDQVELNKASFKIGKVYKKYVAEQLSATRMNQ